MPKLSAGIIPFRVEEGKMPEVLLVHPGGPFWKNKDLAAWSMAKGEYTEGEDPLSAAKREFTEETGNVLPGNGFIPLNPVKVSSGKIISAWAVEANFDKCFINSNMFEMEWPPKSGKKQLFAEVDAAAWFTIEEAFKKINKGQIPLIEQMKSLLK